MLTNRDSLPHFSIFILVWIIGVFRQENLNTPSHVRNSEKPLQQRSLLIKPLSLFPCFRAFLLGNRGGKDGSAREGPASIDVRSFGIRNIRAVHLEDVRGNVWFPRVFVQGIVLLFGKPLRRLCVITLECDAWRSLVHLWRDYNSIPIILLGGRCFNFFLFKVCLLCPPFTYFTGKKDPVWRHLLIWCCLSVTM